MSDAVAPRAEPASGGRRAGERALKNTGVRAAGEVIGKLATFALFAALTRSVGQSAVGSFVFAFAFLQVTMIPIGLGSDPLLVRRVAKDRSAADRLFFNVLGLKLALAGPVIALSIVLVFALGYDARSRETVIVLAAGLLLDLLTRTIYSLFNALERGGLLAVSLVVQRVATAALGIAALLAGYGVVTVAALYSVGAAIGFLLAAGLLARRVGLPRPAVSWRSWRGLVGESAPFAVQDVFTVLIFKLDAVILSLLAAEAAVGRYGAAYRLLESTLFITWALTGAFTAMYAYLGRDTTPSIQSIYQRSIKLSLAILVPCAVGMGVLAEPLSRLAFGAEFTDAAAPLRFLSPVVVMLSLVALSTALIISRRNPLVMARVTAAMVLVNVLLNVALIPAYADTGAAAAMLCTEAVFVVVAVAMAAREVGGLDWGSMLGAPLLAGLAMAAPLLAFADQPLLGVALAVPLYLLVFYGLERRLSPADLRFVTGLVRRRLPFGGTA